MPLKRVGCVGINNICDRLYLYHLVYGITGCKSSEVRHEGSEADGIRSEIHVPDLQRPPCYGTCET